MYGINDYSTYPYLNPDLDFVYNPVHNPQHPQAIVEGYRTPEEIEEISDCGCGCKGNGDCMDEVNAVGNPYQKSKNPEPIDYLILGTMLIVIILILRSVFQ
jgi:hypothetical protein